jgi:small subunit ribosomal protein S27e
MVDNNREVVPTPKSRFYKVKCVDCGNAQVVYSHSTTLVRCKICGKTLSEPTGGGAIINGEIVEEY